MATNKTTSHKTTSHKTTSGPSKRDVEEFRALQEEMLNLAREYSQARLAVWTEESRALQDNWNGLFQGWQSSMEQMAALAGNKFDEIAAKGSATANGMAQIWETNLTSISGQVDQWGENFLQTVGKMASAWMGSVESTQGASGGFSSLLGSALDFGGWFHQGGIVEAHQGMVIAPATLMADEQLVVAQAGEGILPRDSMARLGEKNFEALRTGTFEMSSGKSSPQYDITIQVQSLDASGVAGLDWDRLVQRHLLPALQQEASRRL